jgi:hypothetical protein
VRGRWWSALALYVVGLAILLALMPFSNFAGDPYSSTLGGNPTYSAGALFGCFFWVFGVSAGDGIGGLVRRGRVRTAIRLVGFALLAGIVAGAAGFASYEERRPRWPGYQGRIERFYFGVTPWWAYVGAVVLGLLGVALAVLLYRGRPRGHEHPLPV